MTTPLKDNNMLLDLHVDTKENFTDRRLLPELSKFMFDYNEKQHYIKTIRGGIYNSFVSKLIDYIFDYECGELRPEKWDYYEPIRRPVISETRQILKQELCFPNTEIILKRISKKKNSVFLSNEFIGPTKGSPVLYGDFSTSYLGRFCMLINASSQSDIERAKNITRDIGVLLNTDFGIIKRYDTGEVLYNISSFPYNEYYSLRDVDSISIRLIEEWIGKFRDSSSIAARKSIASFGSVSLTIKDQINNSFQMLNTIQVIVKKLYTSLHTGLLFELAPSFDVNNNLLFEDCVLVHSVDVIISRVEILSLPDIKQDYYVKQIKSERSLKGKEVFHLETKSKAPEHYLQWIMVLV